MAYINFLLLLRYRPENTKDWKTIQINSEEMYETEITELSPGESYDVMVLSEDEHGDGMFSKTIKITTKSNDFPFVEYYYKLLLSLS